MGPKFPRIPKILRLVLLATVCIFAGTLAPITKSQASESDDSAAQVAIVAEVAGKLADEPFIRPITLLLYSHRQFAEVATISDED